MLRRLSVAVCRKLVDRANDWLDRNRDVQVKTCQTMTWMSHDSARVGSGEFMISSKNFQENATTYYLRGLRYSLSCERHFFRQFHRLTTLIIHHPRTLSFQAYNLPFLHILPIVTPFLLQD